MLGYTLTRVDREDSNIAFIANEEGEEQLCMMKNIKDLEDVVLDRGSKRYIHKIYDPSGKLVEKLFYNGLNGWKMRKIT